MWEIDRVGDICRWKERERDRVMKIYGNKIIYSIKSIEHTGKTHIQGDWEKNVIKPALWKTGRFQKRF